MSIKIALGRLVSTVRSGATAKVSEQIPPGAYRFRVAKLLDFVNREFDDYVKQERELVLKYGVKDAEKNTVSMKDATPENIREFNKAIGELAEAEISIPYEPIIFSKLGQAAQDVLTIAHVQLLGPLLVEDEAALTAPVEAAPTKS
jgi:hypothetical protein